MKVHFEDLVLKRRNITATGCCRNIVWIANVAQDAVHERTLLNTVINLRMSWKADFFMTRQHSWA